MRFLSILLFLFSPAALALPSTFEVDHLGKIQLEIPTGWITLEKRLRAPLLLAGPIPTGQHFRPILSLYPLEGLSEAQVGDALEGNESSYRKAKEAWVKEKNGTVETFRPASAVSWGNIKNVKLFGVTYSLNSNRFAENSYYFSCNGKPVFVKVLQPLHGPSAADNDVMAKILQSIRCEPPAS